MHLLVLDEITTHLDFHTLMALQSALSTFSGAILVASHDRFFVRSVVEGKRGPNPGSGNRDERVEEDPEKPFSGRQVLYVMKNGTLNEQNDGVAQFEKSLQKRILKMLGS
jgi:hypothetical protein